jgi:hypothetical protein
MMSTATKPLEELIQELPPVLRAEVRDFVEFLLIKRERPGQRQLRQDWAEALKADYQQYTSVDLQHRASEWRTE